MPYIDPEVILEAKRMDLLTYLQNYEPHELVHFSGNTYCTRSAYYAPVEQRVRA